MFYFEPLQLLGKELDRKRAFWEEGKAASGVVQRFLFNAGLVGKGGIFGEKRRVT